ncbi:YicS family protein [Pantoea phytobeneficialis]|uniref:Uncharacterized protein YicS n=1 Tax=Pantoea phytobeneficialis TaxID=2052056 RepID=A0AAP9H9E4_9GAMM|nr:YicS family protein [Pantoea phytobeneficialis]MDO6407210.1 YicS family protein [Pantoea phytobeneficialis]QGR09180.1 hypothetical protein CTZ24_22285 [Pantoea phytobeneficialis]
MRYLPLLVLVINFCPLTSLAKSAYDDLAYALREQQIIGDLKQHCHIPAGTTDEHIRQVFLNSKDNHDAVIHAAQALKARHKDTYQHQITQVSCPDKSAFMSH